MDLHDAFIVERYRHLLALRAHHAGTARRALTVYAVVAAVVTGGAVTLVSARESLGLDTAVMPAMLAILAWLLVFVAAVAVLQILVARVRWHRTGRIAAAIDPDAPAASRVWWLPDLVFVLLIAGSAAVGWILLARAAAVVGA
ncbi:MAG: hypothetical protein ACREL5_05220 [Gemmatimonadales bacterium]